MSKENKIKPLKQHNVVRSADEIAERMKENAAEVGKWRDEIKKERAKHIEIRDTGYIDHCRERIVDAQAENNALRWVLGIVP